MSVPAFGWALEQGVRLKLLASDRLVLIYLADLANGALVCWPGQPLIERFTGLAPNTVMVSLKRLEAKHLIRAETSPGRATRYHILRQTPANGAVVAPHNPRKSVGGAPANNTGVTPANGAVVPPQNVGGHPPNREAEPPHNLRQTPANGAPDPSSTQVRDPKSRAPAREGSKILRFGKKQEDAAPSPVPPATPGSDDFNSFLDAPTPTKALPCEIEQDVIHGEVPEPDQPVDPQAFKALIAAIACGFKNNHPPRATDLSRSEQINLCQNKPRIRPAYLPDAVLRLQRQELAERATRRA